MAYKGKRQQVTGLTVNCEVNIAADYYSKARAMCHSLFTRGYCYIKNTSKMIAKPENSQKNLNRLAGIMNFIDFVRKEKIQPYRALKGFMKLYYQFLFYKNSSIIR